MFLCECVCKGTEQMLKCSKSLCGSGTNFSLWCVSGAGFSLWCVSGAGFSLWCVSGAGFSLCCRSRSGSDFYFDADPDPEIFNKWPIDPPRFYCEPARLQDEPPFWLYCEPRSIKLLTLMRIRIRRSFLCGSGVHFYVDPAPVSQINANVEICGTEFRVIRDLWASPFKKINYMPKLRQICKTAGINLRNFGNAHIIFYLLWITICRLAVLCTTVSSFRGSQLHDICLFEQSLFTSFYR